MPYGYGSVGAAFTGGLEDYMQQQFTQRLLMQREAREQKIAEDEHNERVAALEEKRQEARERMREKEKAEVEKTVANMEPGDIPDADLVENARKHHVPIRLVPPKPVQPVAPESIAAMGAEGQPQTPPVGTGVMKDRPQQQTYAGSMKQRAELDKEAKVKELMQRIPSLTPGTPEYQQAVLEYEMATGKSVPQRTGAADGSEPVARVDPARRVVQRLVNGQWVDQTGDMPPKTHWLQEPTPKDTSARDARNQTHLDQVHQQAITELDKWATPIETQKKGVEDLGTAINAMTPQADALIAPLVLKATVAGSGSGFRMNQAEIERIVGGRSNWETLNAKLNKWATDPSQALSITDAQRKQLRDLTREIRRKATAKLRTITDIRHQIDDADDPKTINRLRTKLQEELNADESEQVDAIVDLTTGTVTRPGKK